MCTISSVGTLSMRIDISRKLWRELPDTRLGAAVVAVALLTMLTVGCVSKTPYPADWAPHESTTGQRRRFAGGTYLNQGTFTGPKGVRGPILLTELLALSLQGNSWQVNDYLESLGSVPLKENHPRLVALEIMEADDPVGRLAAKLGESSRRSYEAMAKAMDRFLPAMKKLRIRPLEPSAPPIETIGFVRTDGSFVVLLLSSGGQTVRCLLEQTADGALAGRIVDDSAGVLIIPYYSYSDRRVRFEAAPGR